MAAAGSWRDQSGRRNLRPAARLTTTAFGYMAKMGRSSVIRKKRWQIVLMLFLAGIVNYLDRSALSVAAPLVTTDLGLTPADLGLVFSSFFVGYAIFNFIGGWASDKLGGKRVFSLAMAVWSVLSELAPDGPFGWPGRRW